MVHRMAPFDDFPSSGNKKFPVKAEFEDSIDENLCSLSKRPKLDFSHHQDHEVPQSVYNPLEEPSPLGLKLKKSPSLLDLIQMKLSQERKSAPLAKTLAKKEKEKEKEKGVGEKIKASNFPAALLKIGTWEYKSRYEGDLVAKCYFAKHKLVWEVLDGGLKNKIEIQWSDIMAIKANYPDNAPETLDVVLARQPLFFREINPQPRKHTLWQATSDFTSGQATIHRRHYLEFPEGTLGKHFEKLMQCDPRLRFLSQQPEMVLDTPYFQPMVSIFGDQGDHNHGFELKTEITSSFSGFRDTVTSSGMSSSDFENQDPVGTPTEYNSKRNPPISEMFAADGEASSKMNEAHGLNLLNQIKLPGLHPSMSVGDLVNHIGQCISEQIRSDNPNTLVDEAEKKNILEDITQYLLSDSLAAPVSDEKFIMSRVNSLCCLLQKEPTRAQSLQVKPENALNLASGDTQCDHNPVDGSGGQHDTEKEPALEGGSSLSNGCKQGPGMSRKDSVGELLLHLPRIASLPRLLINVPEDSGSEGRW